MSPTLSDLELDQWLAGNWDDICRHAAARAAGTTIWNRRLRAVNTGLAAAAVLMILQVGWSCLILVRLQAAAFSMAEVLRLTLS